MEQTALFAALALALAASKLLGGSLDRLRLPPILGQILAGILLVQLPGPFPAIFRGEVFGALSDLGLVMLLFMTGTESRLTDIRRAGLPSTLVALGGVLVPFGAGIAAARVLGFDLPQALAIGALFTPTSIGVTAVALLETHRLRTKVGATLVGAAIIDDILALVLVAVVLGTGHLAAILGKAVLFFAVAGIAGWKLLPLLYRPFRRVRLPEAPVAFVLVAALAFSALAEGLGVAAVTGAFLAGLAVHETMGEEKLIDRVHAIAFGLFVPLFFIRLGAVLRPDQLGGVWAFAPLLLAASFGGKFAGAWIGAMLARLGWARSVQVGVGMLPRLEISLVIIALAARQGIFPGAMADAMAGFALLNMALSLLLTPALLRASFRLEHEVELHHPPLPPQPGPGGV